MRHYASGGFSAKLSSEQLHKLTAEFDPTQKARWESILENGELVFQEDVFIDNYRKAKQSGSEIDNFWLSWLRVFHPKKVEEIERELSFEERSWEMKPANKEAIIFEQSTGSG
jgi:hypothetical protein